MNFDQLRISDIDVIVKVPQPADKVCVFEDRKNYGLLFVEYGKLYYEHSGIKHLSDNKNVVFIPKGITYKLHCIEASSTYVINFNLSGNINIDTIQNVQGFHTSSILNLLSSMERLWTLHTPSYISRTLGMLYEIIARLSVSATSTYCPQYKLKKIAPSIEYVEQNFNNPEINNELLASLSGVSTVYFRKLFSEIFNVSPMKYVNTLRIEKARDILRSGYSSVSDTATAVGFTNVYHFSRFFKQSTGVTPSQYMEQCNRQII